MNKVLTLISMLLMTSMTVQAEEAAAPADPAANSAANIEVAEAYLAAYSTFDPDRMEPFLTEDAVFEDLTSTTQNASGGAFVFTGKQAILQGLGDYAAQYERFSVSYSPERRYESNGAVVFIAQLSYDLETRDGRTFEGTAPIVTVITVRDGKVARHVDYYDYNGNAVDF